MVFSMQALGSSLVHLSDWRCCHQELGKLSAGGCCSVSARFRRPESCTSAQRC